MSFLKPLHFRVPSLIFWPSGGQIFGQKWCFWNFLKKILAPFISYLAFTLMGWVSWPLHIWVFLSLFSALWWPNILPKIRIPELFVKTIGSIHFIPGIYPDGVSLLTPIHFRVPSLIFDPLVAKYLSENGVSGTFWKNYWLNSFFSWRIPTCVAHNRKMEIFFGCFWMSWEVIRAGVYCPHLWAQLVYISTPCIYAMICVYLLFFIVFCVIKLMLVKPIHMADQYTL